LLDLLPAEIKRNITSAGYVANNLVQKLNRFIAKDYLYQLIELAANAIRYHGKD
jgi:hypothetical protein